MRALPRGAARSIPALFSWAVLIQLLVFAGCDTPRMSQADADAPSTAANSCATRQERCNGRDDDCDGILDENADSSCAIAHASATCVRGACVIEHCSKGYFNCNGVDWDGCEAALPCGECSSEQSSCGAADASAPQAPDAAAAPSMSQRTGTPSAPAASMPIDASIPAAPQSQAGQAGAGDVAEPAAEGGQGGHAAHSSQLGGAGASGGDADADGGITGQPANMNTDAGGCEPERCDEIDNDCDQKIDEEGACSCARSAPTGQGEQCDRCVCDQCAEALDNCTGTSDDEWNKLCGDVLRCFGKSVQAGLCTGSDSDCYQSGDGPCAAEFRSAFSRGYMCTSNPVRVPCGGLTRVRLECYKTKCSAFCKS